MLSSKFQAIARAIVNEIRQQAFIPIILASILACLLFTARVFRSQTLAYGNLVWNLALAWIPYILAISTLAIYRILPRRGWLLVPFGFLWLIFFPNAPYIVTDFLHLEQRIRVPLWYDILLLVTFAWTGLFLAMVSLRTMQRLVFYHLGTITSWLFVGASLGLGGLGIYLGRFSRFNSWDIFLHPNEVLLDISLRLIRPLSNLRFFGFTALFTAFLLVVYLTFISNQRITETAL